MTPEVLHSSPPRAPIRGLVVDIALNALVPVLLYQGSKHYLGDSELIALTIAATGKLSY